MFTTRKHKERIERIEKLEFRAWKLENPFKYNVGDEFNLSKQDKNSPIGWIEGKCIIVERKFLEESFFDYNFNKKSYSIYNFKEKILYSLGEENLTWAIKYREDEN